MATSTTIPTLTVVGGSGTRYAYELYLWPTNFRKLPANYHFVRRVGGRDTSVYAGETEDLSNRFDGHHKLPCIQKHGATHIAIFINRGGKQARLSHERDVIAGCNPLCND